jgi:hypothetical protein
MVAPDHQLAGRLPPRWSVEKAKNGRRLRLRGPDGARAELVMEKKRRLEPRDVAALAARLGGPPPSLIVAPFLSRRTRDLLCQAGLSFIDETGNVRIALDRPALFIECSGAARDPRAESARPIRSLKGRAAGRVVRALCDFASPFGIRSLAERSASSLGSVARVVAFLDGEALLSRDERGRVTAVKWAELLRRWAEDYDVMRTNETSAWLAPRGLETLLAKLRSAKKAWCLTGSMAAVRKAPVAPARLATLYVDDPERLAERLDLRRAEAGANVVMARPYDSVVFDRTWQEDGLRFAALSQVVVDLLTGPGRGPAEAEELLAWMVKHEPLWRA